MLKSILNSGGILYLIFALTAISGALIIIPRNLYKKFFLYGSLLGGLADVVISASVTFMGLHRYTGFGPFGLFGIYCIWTPITWTFAFMLFFYFLPVRKVFFILYLLIWSGLNYSIGIVMENLNLFHYYGIDRYIAPLIFLVWYSVAAWVFRKSEQRIKL